MSEDTTPFVMPVAQNGRVVNKWIITLSVMIPTLIEILDTSVANVALTHIQGSLSAGQEEVTWVLTSYLVANAVVIPMSGWLAKLFGRKVYLLLSLLVFTAGSVLCGMATSLEELILFRILQGVGGGGLQPMSQAILMETFPPRQRGLAMAIFGMGVVLGPILGPLLGGWLTDNLNWRWIFYINLPVGILALFMVTTFIHDPEYQERYSKGDSVDYIGLALLVLGIGCLQIVLDTGQQHDWFHSDMIVILSLVAAVCLVFLVFWELTRKQPVLDLRIFRDKSFATGNFVMFFGFFAFFGSIVLLPMFLQGLMGYTALQAGLVLGPGGAVALLAMPLVGKLTERMDSRLLLGVGLLISAYSLLYMSHFSLHIDFATAVWSRAIQGLGMPFFFVALSYLTFAYVPRESMNNASAIFNLLRNLGGSFGTAFVTTLLAQRAQFHHMRLIEHLSPLNPGFALRLQQIENAIRTNLGQYVDAEHYAQGYVYQRMYREAVALSYNDAFHAQFILFIGLIFMVAIIKKAPSGKRGAPPGH